MKNSMSKSKMLFGATFAAALLFTGCGNSENFVFTNTQPVPVAVPPVAQNDAYSALGNATINYTAGNGVLTNDTLNGASISAFDAVGSQGGTVVLNADGSFSYTPVFGFVGVETFDYTLSNADGDSTATVTMTSTGEGFFVNNQAAPGGDGSQASPFDTLAAAVTAAGSGDTIFVSRGDGTTAGLAGPINLDPGVNLIGEGQGLILTQTIVAPGQAPVLTGPITCGGTNTISGILLDGQDAATDGVIVNAVGDVTVSNNTFRNYTESYIDVDNATGTNTIDGNQFDPETTSDSYIAMDSTDANCTFNVTNNVFDDDNVANPEDAIQLAINGTSVVSFTFTGNAINGSDDGSSFGEGVELDALNTSSVTITCDMNTISNVNLDGFDLESDGGSLSGSVSGNIISNTDSEGIDIETNGGTTTISGNTISNAGGNGMLLDLLSGGTFVVSNNTVTGSSGDAIDYDESEATNPALLAIRNNTLTDSGDDSIDIEIGNATSVCCEIIGNTVNNDMRFNDDSTGVLQVEDFANLMTINNFTAGIIIELNGGVTPVVDGFCAIP